MKRPAKWNLKELQHPGGGDDLGVFADGDVSLVRVAVFKIKVRSLTARWKTGLPELAGLLLDFFGSQEHVMVYLSKRIFG